MGEPTSSMFVNSDNTMIIPRAGGNSFKLLLSQVFLNTHIVSDSYQA